MVVVVTEIVVRTLPLAYTYYACFLKHRRHMILKGAEGKCMDIGGDDLDGSSSGGFGAGGSGGAGDSGTGIAIASGPAAVADSIGDTGLRAGFRAQLLMGEWVVLPAGCQP
jgi:hypothetical protein